MCCLWTTWILSQDQAPFSVVGTKRQHREVTPTLPRPCSPMAEKLEHAAGDGARWRVQDSWPRLHFILLFSLSHPFIQMYPPLSLLSIQFLLSQARIKPCLLSVPPKVHRLFHPPYFSGSCAEYQVILILRLSSLRAAICPWACAAPRRIPGHT